MLNDVIERSNVSTGNWLSSFDELSIRALYAKGSEGILALNVQRKNIFDTCINLQKHSTGYRRSQVKPGLATPTHYLD